MLRIVLFVLVLAGLAGTIGYGVYRNLYSGGYIVEYQTECDPSLEACFSCEGPDCSYDSYKVVRKYASDVSRACGTTVVDCAGAATCSPHDRMCEITYCSPDEPEVTCAVIPSAADESPE